MVDGVSFNPFTNKAFTDEEIKKLDLNNDGTVSKNEYNAGVSWLSGAEAKDSDAIIDETDNLSDDADTVFNNAKKDGIKDKAGSKEEFNQFMSTVTDSYIENYMKKNPDMTAADKSTMIAFIQSKSAEFVEKQTKGSATTFDMKNMVGQFSEFINTSLTDRKTKMTSVTNQINGYKNNEGNFDKLADCAAEAGKDYLTDAEYQKLKTDTTKYLLGEMLKGDMNPDLLKSIYPHYASTQNYKNIQQALQTIQTSSDPDKIKDALNTASAEMTKLLGMAAKQNIGKGITDNKLAKVEEEFTKELTTAGDAYVESVIASNPGMSQEKIDELSSLVKGCVSKYAAECAEKDPQIDTADVKGLVQAFPAYIDGKRTKLVQTKAALNEMGGDSTRTYNAMTSTYKSANSDKYVSEDERNALIKTGTDFLINQLLNGVTNSPMLKAVNSSYASNADYKNALSAVNKMKNETDPDKLAELMNEAKKSMNKFLTDCGKDKLLAGVKSVMPMEISGSSKNAVINNSTIASDYTANVTRNSSYGKQNDDSLKEIQEQAKKDLEALAESMKAQLKSELGSQYDEATVTKYLNDAMNDTLAQFTENVGRRTRSNGNYNAKNDDFGFVFLRKKGTKSGRYSYNLQNLSDSFINSFNKISKDKNASKIDSTLGSYDKDNVINNSVGNDYYRNSTQSVKGDDDDKNAYAQLVNQAKAQLVSIAAQIKASLVAEGVSLSDIDAIIEKATNDTISEMSKSTDNNGFYHTRSKKFLKKAKENWNYDTRTLVDKFTSKVDAGIKEAKEKEQQKKIS